MLERLVVVGVRYLVRDRGRFSGQPWIYTSAALLALRLVRRVWGRRPVTETLSVRPGETFRVEGLSISHRNQIKESRRADKQSRRADKQSRRADKAARREAKKAAPRRRGLLRRA